MPPPSDTHLGAPERLAAVRRTALLDSPPEEAFDRLTRMAARLLGAPVALVTLVAEDRQFFKSATGLPEPWASCREGPLSHSFCRHVAASGEPLLVEDARRHPVLQSNPAVRELGWIAYAGVPLVTRQGEVVGAFSVADGMPRDWSERDLALLRDLASCATSEIELRMPRSVPRTETAGNGRPPSPDVFEDAGIPLGIASPEGRWIRVNRALCGLLGYQADDLRGQPVEGLIHADDRQAQQEALRLLRAGECPTYTSECRCLRRTGEETWGLVTVTLVPDADERTRHLVFAVQDIGDRKRVEAELRESEERYRLMVRATRNAVWDWDLRTNRVVWGEGLEALFGHSPSGLQTDAGWWYERIHAEDREQVVARIRDGLARQERSWEQEYRFRRGDGTYARVVTRSYVATDHAGEAVRVVGAMAERARNEEALAQSTQLLQQVLEALPVGVWVLGQGGRIVYGNAAGQQIWGGARYVGIDGFTQYKGWWADSGRPIAPDEWAAARALARGEISLNELIRIEGFDGSRRVILNSAVPITGPGGEIEGAIVLNQDVSELRAAEEALHRSEEQLRQAQKMEAVGQLAGGIAHDFNNLLTAILSYCDLLLDEVRHGDPIRADVEQIRQAGQRAAGLTRQLLAFSRRQVLQPRVLSLNTVVAETDGMLRRLLGADIVLDIAGDPDVWQVLADPGQMEQVLLNLVVNARDAMPQGGRLTLTISNRELAVDAPERPHGLRPGAYAVLEVSDTGSGIDPANLSRIFEPFFTTKEPGKGTGLGLSTVYGIVQQSGGHIAVQSAPGRGARFTIFLPRHIGGEPAPGVSRPDRRRLPSGTETLLLVEDEAAVRTSARRLLERQGYTVLEARHGADALRIAEESGRPIDLVVTDLVMPEMGGRELAERLRAHRPGLKVLFISGYTERAITVDGVMPPNTGFVEKPFTVEQLMRRLREILEETG
jgi:PAS domain S-box-containing protein